MRLTNNTGLSLFAQVFLATDNYDHAEAGLSVTTLLKPIKQVILSQRVPESAKIADVSDYIPSGVGSAVHDGFERAWKSPTLADTLVRIGVAPGAARKVRVNPTPEEVAAGGIIPVYTEVRSSKIVHGVKVTGKFDFIGDGVVEDLKNTGVYKYMSGDNEAYVLQGSLYRWLNPEKVTKDWMNLTFNFTDWSRRDLRMNPDKYPPNRMMTVRYNLLSIDEANTYVENRVADLIRLKDVTEDQLPPCTDKQLWRKADQHRYFANPAKATEPGARSTKNFDSYGDALQFQASKGGAGVIITKRGEVTACKFCSGFLVCQQAQQLIAMGDLVL